MIVSGGYLDRCGLGVCSCPHMFKFPRVSLTFRSNHSYEDKAQFTTLRYRASLKAVFALNISDITQNQVDSA